MQMKVLATLLRSAPTSPLLLPPDAEPELEKLINALERNGDRTLSDLVRVIDKAWPKPKAPAKKTTPAPAINPSIWVSRLNEARGDSSSFETLLQSLAKSKQLKATDVVAIANGFRSTTKNYRSKSAAIEDIRKAWMEDRRDSEKAQKTEGIF